MVILVATLFVMFSTQNIPQGYTLVQLGLAVIRLSQ